MEFQEIDAKGSIKIERVTTATFPTTAYYAARLILNTDTKKMYFGTGSEWIEVNDTSTLLDHINDTATHGIPMPYRIAGTNDLEGYSPSGHNHDDTYSPLEHEHNIAIPGTPGFLSLNGSAGAYLDGTGAWVEQESDIPIGTVIAWPGDIIPENFYECDGSEYLVAQHTELFAVIGTKYGATYGESSYFGNSSDGNVILSVNTQLSRNMQYNKLTINAGVTLDTRGYTVKVRDTLTNNGSIINTNGIGSGATGGTGGKGGDCYCAPYDPVIGGTGGTGGEGGYNSGDVTIYAKTIINNSIISTSGGNGNAGNAGGTGDRFDFLTLGDQAFSACSGGGGGGGGGNGGNAGNLYITYETFDTTGTLSISGGTGGAGGAGGGTSTRFLNYGNPGYIGEAGEGNGGNGGNASEILEPPTSGSDGGAGSTGTSGTYYGTYQEDLEPVESFNVPDSSGYYLHCIKHH